MKLAQDDQIVLLKTGQSRATASLLFPDFSLSPSLSLSLLPSGSFELSCLRMSRYYHLSHDGVLFGDSLLTREAFMRENTGESGCCLSACADPRSVAAECERKLVGSAFSLAKSVAELKLTENELGLFSAIALLNPGESEGEGCVCRLTDERRRPTGTQGGRDQGDCLTAPGDGACTEERIEQEP